MKRCFRWLLLPLLLFAGCVVDSETNEEHSEDLVPVIIDDSLFAHISSERRDEISIITGEIRQNTLHLEVLYIGGCHEHDFILVTGRGFAKSNPPQSTFLLGHDAKDDTCTQDVREKLRFDLTPLKKYYQQWSGKTSGTIIIRLSGLDIELLDKRMWYSFNQ